MKVSGEYRRVALIQFDNTDFVDGVFKPALVLPNNARILSGNLVVDTASNAGTTDTLAFADLKIPMWKEEMDDYENVKGIAVRKMMGVLQPQFPDPFTNTLEDFNRICVDTAI